MVEWASDFWSGAKRATNIAPGIVLKKDDSHRQVVYTILWSCNTISVEHAGLVRRMRYDKG